MRLLASTECGPGLEDARSEDRLLEGRLVDEIEEQTEERKQMVVLWAWSYGHTLLSRNALLQLPLLWILSHAWFQSCNILLYGHISQRLACMLPCFKYFSSQHHPLLVTATFRE